MHICKDMHLVHFSELEDGLGELRQHNSRLNVKFKTRGGTKFISPNFVQQRFELPVV